MAYPKSVRKFLCYRPRVVRATCVVDGDPAFDPTDQSIISFHYRDLAGSFAGHTLNETIEIGTSPGKRDVGLFRLRKQVNTGSSTVYVNETAFGDVPIADGMFVTFIYDRIIWEKKIHRELIGPIDFTETSDYDIAYGGENDSFYPPIINVTRNAVDKRRQYFPMGMVDDGEDYRTVYLSVFFSQSLVNPITSISWYFLGGTEVYVLGSSTVATIAVQLPVGYVEARVGVLTATGLAIRYIDLWTFSGPDDPNLITQFSVDNDQRSEGRDMDFTVWDEKSKFFPEGTKIGYFEVPDWAGETPDPLWIGQFMGWTTSDAVGSRIYRNFWQIKVGGYQTWLNRTNIGAQTIYDPRTPDDPHGVANRYIEQPDNTPDKTIHYFLRTNSNALEMMNLFLSDYSVPIEGYTSEYGSIWSVIVGVANRYFGVAACDSIGSIFLMRHFDYLEQVDRDLIDPLLSINKSFWLDESAPSFTEEKSDKVGIVDFYGSNYDILYDSGGNQVDFSHVFRVNAPGYIPGKGPGSDSGQPSIFLQITISAGLQLRRLGGHYFAFKNNKLVDLQLILRYIADVIEVAWGIPIAITYTEDNARNLVFTTELFLIKTIGVQHSNETDKPSKIITWTMDRVTKGYPGLLLDVTQKINIEEYPIPILSAGTRAIGGITQGRTLYFIHDIDTASPITSSVNLTGLIPDNIKHFVPSPFSSYYLQTGSTIDIYLITIKGDIYRISDIVGVRTTTLLFTAPASSTGHFIQYERGRENYIVATYLDSLNYPHVVVSTNGSSFTDYNHSDIALAGPSGTNFHLSSHSDGIYLPFQILSNPSQLWLSTNLGVTFNFEAEPEITAIFSGIHVPFQSGDDSILYSYGGPLVIKSIASISNTNIAPAIGGYPQISNSWSSLKTCDVDKNFIVAIGTGNGTTIPTGIYVSTDEGATWSLIQLDTPTSVPNNCNVAGDDTETLFTWGPNYFGWKQAIDTEIKTKGTISGTLVNIFGIDNDA